MVYVKGSYTNFEVPDDYIYAGNARRNASRSPCKVSVGARALEFYYTVFSVRLQENPSFSSGVVT
jgi:hypothetical protein